VICYESSLTVIHVSGSEEGVETSSVSVLTKVQSPECKSSGEEEIGMR
jgi:hypothetical protein